MKLSAPFVYLVLAIGVAEASASHAQERGLSGHALHARIAKEHRSLVEPSFKRRADGTKRRCKPRATTSSKAPEATKAAEPVNAAAKPEATKDTSNNNNNNGGGKQSSGSTKINNLVDSRCGPSGATEDITTTSGPNGSLDWFNCGINEGGWTPPAFTVDQVHTKDLSEALAMPNSPFKACGQFIDLFYKYGEANNIPPIMIASIAMQESSCNPHTVGGGGEQGLMQITKDKCGGAPGGNCQDADFNVRIGAGFLAGLIRDNGGNILEAVGRYNGWRKGLTKDQATAARWSSCCMCQNNLDYLAQFLLGWVNGIDPRARSPRIGAYFNLDPCGH